jgi:hypothetical protein
VRSVDAAQGRTSGAARATSPQGEAARDNHEIFERCGRSRIFDISGAT